MKHRTKSDCMNSSSNNDLSDDSGKDPGCYGHSSEEPEELALKCPKL